MKTANLTLLLMLSQLCCIAQYTVKGRVIGQADTKPAANASVFISNATIGDKTSEDGSFTLQHIKPGKYELVVSLVGFEKYTQTITIADNNINLPDITIYPKTVVLSEVKIKAGNDPDRQRYYEWFKEEFIGKSELAKECKILNPELLDLSYDEKRGILTASSVDFLTIENKALGYRLKFLLSNFTLNNYDDINKSFSYTGSVFFERMKGTKRDEEQWTSRRQEMYEGSELHFLRAVIDKRMTQEGFRVERVPATKNPQRPPDSLIARNINFYSRLKNDDNKKAYRQHLDYWVKKSKLPAYFLAKPVQLPLAVSDIIKRGKQPGSYYLSSGGADGLFISYNKYRHFNPGAYSHLSDPDNTSCTLVMFNEPDAFFDSNGSLINPQSITYSGAWNKNRLAGLLPADYEPREDVLLETDSLLVKKLGAKLTAYQSIHITEKAYLHFDKPYYAAGDTIYFKAYLTEGESHMPSHLSGVLYADLINDNNKISRSIRMQITGGTAFGDFALPRSLAKGSYRIRAYTQWMRNEGEEAYFDKTIDIGTALAEKVPEGGSPVQKPAPAAKADIKFMPEGGSLIAGIRSKIAFKAVGADGLGVDVKGVVLDSEHNEVAIFAAEHLGMGYFYLTPAETQTYSANVTYPNGTHNVIDLPKIDAAAISMAFTDQARSYTVRINSSRQWYGQNKNKSCTLVIYSGGDLQSFTVKPDSREVIFDIAKSELHPGIAVATLFSAAGEPLCERLLFVQGNNQLNLNIGSDTAAYAAKTKTGIKLSVTNAAGDPSPGNFSVAVIDESKVPVDENAEWTIVNNLLLTSDLKGYIEQPNYYFTNITDKTIADLDLVMLTHGYRRFEWQKTDNNPPIAFQAEKGLTISGMVDVGGRPVTEGRVKLLSKGAGGLLLDTLSDAGGRFVFDNIAFNDTTKFVLQARTANGQKDVDIKPDTVFSQPDVAVTDAPRQAAGNELAVYAHNSKLFLDEQDKNGINKHTHMLKEVEIKDKRINHFVNSANLNGGGNADQIITADYLETSGYTNLYDAVRAKATFIEFTRKHRLKSNRTIAYNGKSDDMVIIVDGTPMYPDPTPASIFRGVLDDYSASDIESVEILLGAHYGAVYGSIASGGAVIVTTKKGRKINNYYKESPGVITFKANGFYKARRFYSPEYNYIKPNNELDLRNTIYWNPNINTDKDGKASFSYFNADGKGTYRVVIEGIDADGNLGRQVFRYKVE